MRLQKLKKVFPFLLFPFLILSFLLNIILYLELRKYYTLLYAIELDPLGLNDFQENTNQTGTDPALQTVLFFGDSRAAQWPSPDLEGFRFINRGIGNQSSAQVAGRFDAHVRPLKPDVIVLQVCINDLKTIPLFPGKKQQIIQDCMTHLKEIVQDSLEQNSVVVISTIFPVGNVPWARRLVWSQEIEHSRQEVNEFIRTLASDRVIVLDAENVLANDKGSIKQDYSLDTLHLNKAGYQALNLELIRILDAIKESQE